MKEATDITFVLDSSGSMASVWSDVEGGVSGFIETQKDRTLLYGGDTDYQCLS